MKNKLAGIHRKPHVRVDSEMLARMKLLYEQGTSPKVICERLALSQPTFSNYKARGFTFTLELARKKGPSTTGPVTAPDFRDEAGAPLENHLLAEQTSPIHNLGPKPLIRISGHPAAFWGLRLLCGKRRAGGGNYFGNVSKSGAGPEGVVALKNNAIANIALRGGSFIGLAGYTHGTSWTGGGADYVGHVQFGSAEAAFRYLSQYFHLCACPDALGALHTHDVSFIKSCDKSASTEIVEV